MSFSHYLRQLALLIRLPNTFTIFSNVIAAYVLGTHGVIAWGELSMLLAASLCFYHGGMILNDCVDIQEDRIHQPHRPLAARTILPLFAWVLCVYLLVFGCVILLGFDARTRLFGLLLVMCIVAYNFSSRNGYVGCVFMGLCRALNWLVVLAAVGQAQALLHYAVLVGMYVLALTLISRDENSAAHRTQVWAAGACLVAAVVLFMVFESARFIAQPTAAVVLVFLLLSAIIKLWQLYAHYTPFSVRGAVKFFILGLIPLDATLLYVGGHSLIAIIVLGLIVPSRILAKRFYVT